MLTIIFTVVLIWVAWKMLVLGVKAAWGIAKILCAVLMVPLFIFGLFFVGLFYLALPVFIVYCIFVLIGRAFEV